jgi:hypothetical protein
MDNQDRVACKNFRYTGMEGEGVSAEGGREFVGDLMREGLGFTPIKRGFVPMAIIGRKK